MTNARQPSQPIPRSEGFTAPLVVWLGAQLLAIGLAAARVPLWANAPRASELLALEYLLIAQISVSSLIFPWMMRSMASSVVTIATAWPMVFFAGLLSPAPLNTLFFGGVYVNGWLVALAILHPPLSSTGPSLTTPMAALWACGGPILQFLNLEYGSAPLRDGLLQRVALGPILAGLRLIQGEIAKSFEVLAAAIVVSVIIALTERFVRSRQAAENSGRP